MHKTVVLGLLHSADSVLLVKQAYGYHLWTLPGGEVEPGETLVDAVVREMREETGLDTHVQGLIALRNRVDQTCLVFVMQALGGSLVPSVPGEIEAIQWFTHEEVRAAGEAVEQFPRYILSRTRLSDTTGLQVQPWKGYTGSADLFIGDK